MAIVMVAKVHGMYLRRPPILRMSCSPPTPWMTEPAPRKSRALKKAWVIRWKTAGRVGGDSGGHEHVAQLGDRGVGEDALDVGLGDADGGGEEAGEGADDGDGQQRDGRAAEDEVGAAHHVDAGGDHGGGVDERGDRRGALHRVGQPDVEGDLRALAGGADQHEQADGGEDSGGGLDAGSAR